MHIFNLIKQLFQKQPPKEIASGSLSYLRKELVPLSGEADSLQGELIRCVDNLSDEAKRNGWMNWDERHTEAIAVLRRFLPADQFPGPVKQEIHKALDAVHYAGKRGADEGEFGYEELDYLTDRVKEWCSGHPELRLKHPEATWLDADPFHEPSRSIAGSDESPSGRSAPDWPFDQPRNCGAITMRQVLKGTEPILLVSHDEDDHGWQFIGSTDASAPDGRVVRLEHIVDKDPTVLEVADLSPGWQAVRDAVGARWKRRRRAERHDDEE